MCRLCRFKGQTILSRILILHSEKFVCRLKNDIYLWNYWMIIHMMINVTLHFISGLFFEDIDNCTIFYEVKDLTSWGQYCHGLLNSKAVEIKQTTDLDCNHGKISLQWLSNQRFLDSCFRFHNLVFYSIASKLCLLSLLKKREEI